MKEFGKGIIESIIEEGGIPEEISFFEVKPSQIGDLRDAVYEKLKTLGFSISVNADKKARIKKDAIRYYPHESHKEEGTVEVFFFRFEEAGGFKTVDHQKKSITIVIDSEGRFRAVDSNL